VFPRWAEMMRKMHLGNAVKLTHLQVLMRSDGEAVAINLPDLDPVETPEGVKWIDPTHANLPDHHRHHHDLHDHNHS
jgi:hypothetical protein